jgi:hypothetical protein
MSMLKEYYLQPEAPDPALSEAEVLRCVRRFVPSGSQAVDSIRGVCRIEPLTPAGVGCRRGARVEVAQSSVTAADIRLP